MQRLPTERSLARSFQGPISAEAVAKMAKHGRNTTSMILIFPEGGCRLAWCSPGHVKNDPGPLWVWWYTVKQLNSPRHSVPRDGQRMAARVQWWMWRKCIPISLGPIHGWRAACNIEVGSEDPSYPRDKPWDVQTYQKSSFSLHEYINASANAKS